MACHFQPSGRGSWTWRPLLLILLWGSVAQGLRAQSLRDQLTGAAQESLPPPAAAAGGSQRPANSTLGAQHRWAQQGALRLGYTPAHTRLTVPARPIPQQPTLAEGPAAAAGAPSGSAPGDRYAVERVQYVEEVVPGEEMMIDPSYADPSYADPSYADPSYADPSYADPSAVYEPWGAFDASHGTPCAECLLAGFDDPVCGHRWWIKSQYLHWWTNGADAPALLTTSSNSTNSSTAAVLGQPGTEVLFGGGEMHGGSQSGLELQLGLRLSPYHQRTLQARWVYLGRNGSEVATSSDRLQVLGRPFFDIVEGEPAAVLIGFPNLVDGNVQLSSQTEFSLLDVIADSPVGAICDLQHHWQVGYRLARLDDNLVMNQAIIARGNGSGLADGTTLVTSESISTRNEFNGVVLGWSTDVCRGPWIVEFRTRTALGSTRGSAALAASTVTTVPGQASVTSASGVLVQPSNSGTFVDDRFAMVPELGIQLHRDYVCGVRVSLGYSFVYWSQVLRAVEQIDTDLNSSQLPPGALTGPARPEFQFSFADFWAQGLNVGAEFRY